MKHSILALAAFAAAAIGMADTANAQRRQAGDVWQRTASRGLAPQETCRPIDTRLPRNFRGVRPIQRQRGYYETRYERVWVPGEVRRVWVPPVYEWRYDSCGRRVRVVCQAGYYRNERSPGYYERQAVRVWVPAQRACVDDRRTRRRVHRVTHTRGRLRG